MRTSSIGLTSVAVALAALLAVAGLAPSVLRGEELVMQPMPMHRPPPEPAPEFAGISTWLNSPPLTMEGLRGNAVLVQFWTLTCINWQRTLPYVARWYATYKDKGFVVVGVHAPEFSFERETSNVESAIRRFGIAYPVAQDNQFTTWKAYGNHYWPSEYLIDQSGKIVMSQFGEGGYRRMDMAIARLVGADPSSVIADEPDEPDLSAIGSPEVYFGGGAYANGLARSQDRSPGQRVYTAPREVPMDRFALAGTWTITRETAASAADGGEIILRFRAPKVNLVAGSPTEQALSIAVDGKPQPPVSIQASRLYVIYTGAGGEHVLRVTIPKAGLTAYSFTFG